MPPLTLKVYRKSRLLVGMASFGACAMLLFAPTTLAQHLHDADQPYPVVSPESVGLYKGRLDTLVAMTQSWSDEGRIVGAEILIVKKGQIALHETVGWSDPEAQTPMRHNSIFRLRSMTKPFTGTAALMLVSQGLLDLGAPVGQYLPSWRNPRSGAITVEQLITHYSGFVQNGTPERASTYPNLRAVVDASGEQGPQGVPGEKFVYSDVNTFALGALVAELTGTPLADFIRGEIIQPLELDDVYVGFATDVAWAARTNPTYERNDSGAWEQYWAPTQDLFIPWFRASGGMLATTLGYAQWLTAWLDPSTPTGLAVGGPGGLLPDGLAARALELHGEDEIAGYGYHWEVWNETPLIFGHSGSDGTLGVAVPSQQLLLFYFTQSRRSGTIAEWLEAALEATAPVN